MVVYLWVRDPLISPWLLVLSEAPELREFALVRDIDATGTH